jgi:hypothetical protein
MEFWSTGVMSLHILDFGIWIAELSIADLGLQSAETGMF